MSFLDGKMVNIKVPFNKHLGAWGEFTINITHGIVDLPIPPNNIWYELRKEKHRIKRCLICMHYRGCQYFDHEFDFNIDGGGRAQFNTGCKKNRQWISSIDTYGNIRAFYHHTGKGNPANWEESIEYVDVYVQF